MEGSVVVDGGRNDRRINQREVGRNRGHPPDSMYGLTMTILCTD